MDTFDQDGVDQIVGDVSGVVVKFLSKLSGGHKCSVHGAPFIYIRWVYKTVKIFGS